MSREDKLRHIDLIAEKKRRMRDSRAVFKPNSGQMLVAMSEAQTVLVAAGNGSGKTAFGANRAMWRANGYDPVKDKFVPVPRRVVVVLDHPDKVADKWLPELRKWFNIEEGECHKGGKPYINRISRPNGSEIKFMFHEQGELVFESIEADDVIFDEPPPRSVYIALLRGLRNRGKDPSILIIATPISGAWLREEIYEPWLNGELKDTECFKFGTSVNEANLPEGYVEWYGSKLTDKEKQIRLHGEFFDLSGLALSHLFKREAHIIPKDDVEWDESWPCVVVFDPAPAKAHVAVLMGCDDNNYLYVLDEYKEKTDGRTFSRHVIEQGWFEKYRVLDIVYDSLGNSENLMGEGYKPFGVLLNEELREAEIGRARATTGSDKDDEDFVERIKDSLLIPTKANNVGTYVPKLRFLSNCVGSINDIETVKWLENKATKENKPKLDITKKDYLACIKYALATNIYHKKKKDKVYYARKPAYGMSLTPKTLSLRGKMRIARR